MSDPKYLKLLKEKFPTVKDACAEIINLKAILALPKGTEYFFSDLHGEHEAFIFMLKSASGVIRQKIDWLFSSSSTQREREELAELICDPAAVLDRKKNEADYEQWCKTTIKRLIAVCKASSEKYTRSKVRKRLPKSFAYIMDELLHAEEHESKGFYYGEIINSLTATGVADEFISELAATVSRLAVDRLHILGDMFDRGPHPDYIMDYLISYDNVDFTWGNHDAAWMGAAIGNWACIANVLRVNFAYNNFDMLEIGYGINLRPLAVFASETYKDDPCECFAPHVFEQNKYDPVDLKLAAKMHKAISIIQFKVEAELARLYPHYNMDGRTLLDKIDYIKGTVNIGGAEYPLKDTNFPTIDPQHPLRLTLDEYDLMERIAASFVSSKALKKHVDFLFSHGGFYKTFNGNLLFHGCIPMTENGDFEKITLDGHEFLSGKAYFDYLDKQVRAEYFSSTGSRAGGALMWYMWSGGKSPLFGKQTITTFQRFFVADKDTHKEKADPYYKHVNNPATCQKIFKEFGLNERAHIVNGHIPVKTKQGESPIKADGRLFVIDGGMAKAYQRTTGIAGYTLIFNSRHLAIAEHAPFNGQYYQTPVVSIVEKLPARMTVGDTDTGTELKAQIKDLEDLIQYLKAGK